MKKILYLFISLALPLLSFGQSRISGKVLSAADNSSLPGATIYIKGTNNGTKALEDGYFVLVAEGKVTILISYTGFETREIDVTAPLDHQLVIKLQVIQNQLNEVKVSTGYQTLPRERVTGSFVQVDNTLINRSVSTDVLSRLSDVVPGLTFNKVGNRVNEQSPISIRGQSTIFARTSPLIVVDNYAYEGDINSINPNDVESITVLKDAAAASIWGTRAGNGVIVITTKKGRFNDPLKVSFNSNVTLAAKPDLFYTPVMSTADFIETERILFAKGFYKTQENSFNKVALTPVVELLIAARDGHIGVSDADAQINALKANDVRRDASKYLYRNIVNQQYALSLTGGSDMQRFYVAGGYDDNRSNSLGNRYRRYSLDANNTYSLLNHRLTFGTGIFTTFSQTPQNAIAVSTLNYAPGKPIYPYAKLADADGNPLALAHTYRTGLISSVAMQGLLNWDYIPLNELAASDQMSSINDYRFNFSTKYQIIPGLNANVLYQYERTGTSYRNDQNTNSWYTRDQINKLTIVNPDGSLTKPIPIGDILDLRNSISNSHTVRTQLDYERNWGPDHLLNVIAGAELRDIHSTGDNVRFYGYDPEHAASQPVDYISNFGTYFNPLSKSTKIQNFDGHADLTDRFISYYSNAGYTYLNRYTVSASARLDQSNLFGVDANQKAVPLYSAGVSWKLSEEPFYKISWLSTLSLRVTHGSSGNIDKTLSAYTTASYFSSANSFLGVPYATIRNPPNPQLRWERVKTTNFGVDFASKDSRISGTVEYYIKKGTDLIGDAPLAPQTGVTQFRGNTASTKTNGVDVYLNSLNIDKTFKWRSAFLLSWNGEKVTAYKLESTGVARDYLTGSYSAVPAIGKPLYGIYSYPWAGLDPKTGDPQGFLGRTISKDYSSIINTASLDNITFNGSARPTVYGALRNSFSYRKFSLSMNLSYRLGYYSRRSSINYSTVLSGLGGHGDYALRWQHPGDEANTSVPSLPAAVNGNRDIFYTYSSVLVQKADNVRLQDITLGYDLSKKDLKGWPLSALHFYAYANNLGIIWKAAKNNLDPDAVSNDVIPLPVSISFGLKGEF
jgi:TonB-linked SusC/RagA family outer membrane protein